MPLHIAELTSEVAAFDGEVPLTDRQVETLVARVLERLKDERARQRHEDEAVRVRRHTGRPAPIVPGVRSRR